MNKSQVEALIQALKDKDYAVRWKAAQELERIGDASAVPALIEASKDKDWPVRSRAAIALGKIGDASAVPALIEASKDWSADVHISAAEALRKIGNAETLPRIIVAASHISAQERINILDDLRGIRLIDIDHQTVCYDFPDARSLCQAVLKEEDAKARKGAQEVLSWLNGDRFLVIASTAPNDLLIAAQGVDTETAPDTLLRASDGQKETAAPPSRPPSLWPRLRRKQG